MNTEAGKIQGNLWSWGLQKERKVIYGNYDHRRRGRHRAGHRYRCVQEVHDQDGEGPSRIVFPRKLKQIPLANVDDIPKHPNQAGLTYSRHDCQRCHVGVRGRERRGDYRGSGCSSCHVPYSNDGFYEGGDPTVDKMQRGSPADPPDAGDPQDQGQARPTRNTPVFRPRPASPATTAASAPASPIRV